MDTSKHKECVAFLKSKIGHRNGPTVGVVCGSGLANLSTCLSDLITIPFKDIPGFPSPTVEGHVGELIFGFVEKVHAVLMRGRFHYYEGYAIQRIGAPVKVMRSLGVETLIVTNAAGGINRNFNIGDIMIIDDHIGFPMMAGVHPLRGPNDTTFAGPRFLPTSDSYNPELRQLTWEIAETLHMEEFVHRCGTYAMVSGPTFESSGESRMLKTMGADAVGMSTIPEVIVARHCGMKVLGLSLISNSVVLPGETAPVACHEEVIDAVNMREPDMERLVKAVMSRLDAVTWEMIQYPLIKSAEHYALEESNKQHIVQDLKSLIERLDISNMTPMDALKELNRLKNICKDLN